MRCSIFEILNYLSPKSPFPATNLHTHEHPPSPLLSLIFLHATWLGIAHEISIKMSVSSVVTHGLAWSWRTWFQPGWLAQMTCRLVLTVGKKPRFLARQTSPQCCWSDLRTWQLPYPPVNDPRESQAKTTPFYNLGFYDLGPRMSYHVLSWDIMTQNHQGKILSNFWPMESLR